MPLAKGDRKVCSACRKELPLSVFDKNRGQKDGLQNQCHDCLKESRRKYREANPALHKARHWKNRYGIALDEYEAMVAQANGVCPVCKEPPPSPFKGFDVDHDHETGKIRGLLCRPCNLALGGARDDPAILRALADYVEHHRANPREDQPPPVLPTFYLKGQAHHQAKLTEAQAKEIKALAQSGVTQAALAARFGIRQTSVSFIVTGRTWKHLPAATAEEAAGARRRWDEEHAKE